MDKKRRNYKITEFEPRRKIELMYTLTARPLPDELTRNTNSF